MKYLYIFAFLVFSYGVAQNNTVVINDPNFEQALVDLDIDDTLDGGVALDSVTDLTYLNVSSKNISNLDGIENFQSLDTLVASNNALSYISTVDIDSLSYLDASYNNITNFDFNPAIEEIYFQNNDLEFVDLSSYSSLKTIILNDNNLKELNIDNNSNPDYQFEDLNFTNNPLLKCIKVNNATYMYAYRKQSINSDQTIFSETDCASYCNTPSTAASDYLTGTFILRDKTLPSLTVNDTVMDYSGPFLGEGQMRQVSPGNTSEERIIPAGIYPNLLWFGPSGYANDTINLNLTCDRINIKLNPPLVTSFFYDHDYFCCEPIKLVTPNDNHVTQINPSSNKKDFVVTYKISPLEVSENVVNDIGSFEMLKINDSYVVNDTNFEQELINLGLDHEIDGKIYADNIYDVESLDLHGSNISDLTGIEGFRLLETLNISNNNITDLNLDYNYYLRELNANNNNLTELNLEAHQELEKLQVDNNDLVAINIKNGHNDNFEPNIANSINFSLLNNSNLSCIDVSDQNHMNTHFSNYIDANASFSEIPCQTMDIDSFDKTFALYPNPADDYVIINNDNAFNITQVEIFDLTGKKVVKNENLDNKGDLKINLESLSRGIYMLKITDINSKHYFKKLIINK